MEDYSPEKTVKDRNIQAFNIDSDIKNTSVSNIMDLDKADQILDNYEIQEEFSKSKK